MSKPIWSIVAGDEEYRSLSEMLITVERFIMRTKGVRVKIAIDILNQRELYLLECAYLTAINYEA
jgi:hypothetical protein